MGSKDIGQRIRAARVYAGFYARPEFSAVLEISEATLQRMERGDRPVKRSELLAIADICRVPMWFLDHGWDGWRRSISPEELRQIADSLPPTE